MAGLLACCQRCPCRRHHEWMEAMGVKTLHLSLKGEYFDAIKAGTKAEEYRLMTPYWSKRLDGRHYNGIELAKGDPARDDHARRIARPWRGFTIKTIIHPHFGDSPVQVYAIKVN